MSENLAEVVKRCRDKEGSLDDYKAAFEFADDTVHGLAMKLIEYDEIYESFDSRLKKLEATHKKDHPHGS